MNALAMNATCDPILDMRVTQEQLKALYERNPALARRNQALVMPILVSSAIPVKSRNKYGNIKVEHHGMKFDSKKELKCWRELELREKAGEICGLIRQEVFELEVNGQKIGRFTADFGWIENGERIVADCKSPATRKETAYRLRKKLFESLYAPLVIREL